MNRNLRFALIFATFGIAGAAAAQVKDYALFRTNSYIQTDSSSLSFDGSFLGAQLGVTDANDFASASFNGNPMDLDATDPENPRYSFASNYYGSQSDLEADYGYPGLYGFTTDANGQPAGSATVEDNAARFSSNAPVVPEFGALQGILPGSTIDLHVDGFTPGVGTDANLTFYRVYNLTSSSYLVDSVASNTPFTIGLLGSDLLAGNDYLVTVIYSSRVTGTGNGFGGAPFTLGYDNRTDFTFSVSPVPEPSAIIGLGLGAAAMFRRHTKRG